MQPTSRSARLPPDPAEIAAAVDVLWSAKRPLVDHRTRRARRRRRADRLLDATGALYLDTQESRGLVPADHPADCVGGPCAARDGAKPIRSS